MKNIKKSYLVIGAILLIVLGVFVFLLVRGGGIFNPEGTTEDDEPVDTESYLSLVKHEGEVKTPVFQSDVENIYYTVSTKGEVSFFEYENQKLSKVEASGSYDITVTLSHQRIPATVHYYKTETAITGFGLFTSEISEADVLHYEYAYFRLMNLPSIFAKTSSYLLLVDTKKEDFLKNDKVFEEILSYNSSTGVSSKILYDANRGIDDRGAYRNGYHLITIDSLNDINQYLHFFSARHYHLEGDGRKIDIFRSGYAGHNNQDNSRRALDVADYYSRSTENGNGFYFLKNKENGFDLTLNTKLQSEDDEVIHSFSGNYDEDYLRYGKYLLEKSSYKITDLETLEEFSLSFKGQSGLKADLFAVDEASGKVFIRGISRNTGAILLADMNTGNGEIYHNEQFLYLINPLACEDGSFLASIANGAENSSYKYVVFA